MSDYEVNLVNDNMQEFHVRFYGPTESKCHVLAMPSPPHRLINSAIRRGGLEDTCRASRPIPLQVAQYRFHEQDFPSQHR